MEILIVVGALVHHHRGVEMAYLATKPSSRDASLVDILAISTNMLHKPDEPRFDTGSC